MLRKSLIIDSKDNVAVLLEKAEPNDCITINGEEIILLHPVEFAHKVAIKDLRSEDIVFKYGEEIGYMLEDAPKGSWIHNHNMGCRRGQ